MQFRQLVGNKVMELPRDGEVRMTFRRGMRRLALFLGVLGAITGAFASYVELLPLNSQWARHDKFEQLANTEVVKQQHKSLQGVSSDEYSTPIPPGAIVGNPAPSSPLPGHSANDNAPATASTPNPPPPDDSVFVPNPFYAPTLNASGIEKVNWANNNEIQSIEAVDGTLYFAGPPPSRWRYVFVFTFPLLGFLVPWGMVSALVWVGAGFFNSSKDSNLSS